MTSHGGHDRPRAELVEQLRAAERGTALPWVEAWRHDPPPLFMGVLVAAFTYLFLVDRPTWLYLLSLTAIPVFQLWSAWRSPLGTRGWWPAGLRRPPWILVASLVVVPVGVWALAQVLDPWPVVVIAGAMAWLLVTWHRRAQARAVVRLEQRLLSEPPTTAAPREDRDAPAQLDPLLDSPQRIGFMSVLVASSRGVRVDFLGEHLGLGESELAALVAELEHRRYVDVRTSRGGHARCTPTYPGSSATRRHRQALRQLLAEHQPA